jgi:hypothetical protein
MSMAVTLSRFLLSISFLATRTALIDAVLLMQVKLTELVFHYYVTDELT